MFNDYVWENYLNAGGRAVAEMFEKNLQNGYSDEYAEIVYKLHKTFCASEIISQDDYVNDIFICTRDELAAQADVLSALNKLIGRKASK